MEFLKSNYFIVFYAVAMLLSLVKYRYYFDSVLKYLPIIIAYTLLSEILGILIRDVEEFQLIYEKGYSYYNQLIFNIFDIIFFLYFYFVFKQTTKNSQTQRLINLGSLLFFLVALINPFLQDIMVLPQVYTIVCGSIVLVFCILNYLNEKSDEKENRQKRDLLFWIGIGLLIFYIFYPIIMSIGILNYEFYDQVQLHKVLRILIAIMYSFFILGFLKTRRRVLL